MENRWDIRAAITVALALACGAASSASADERVIIRADRANYAAVEAKVRELGGKVTYKFDHANGLVADLPAGAKAALETSPAVQYVVRDTIVPNPRPRAQVLQEEGVQVSAAPGAVPADLYSYGAELTGARFLHTRGFGGQGVIVGVIDSGVAEVAAIAGRVLGGESFVDTADEPGPNSHANDPHGTWVATTIGANVGFYYTSAAPTAKALAMYCNPVSSVPCITPYPPDTTFSVVNMVGQAPAARFYAFKVFPAAGGGAPTSWILRAMDRAVQLKTSDPAFAAMKVVNMSLGGPTLFAGHDLEDELASSMAKAGISLVVSSGNAGPSGVTVGSPGTARGILTVGAASSPVNERIVAEVYYQDPEAPFVGLGLAYRPDDRQQMADFSSRGPNADGRMDPEVVANGTWNFVQGPNTASGGLVLNWVSGTSFAAPTVAGVIASLYSAKPSVTPTQMRTAILRSADPSKIPTAREADQGFGYVNAAGALALLKDPRKLGAVPDFGPGTTSVEQNLERTLGRHAVIESDGFTADLRRLRPAERREFFFEVEPQTKSVTFSVLNVSPELPPSQQNAIWGDDLQFAVHSAKTSAISEGDYVVPMKFIGANGTFTVNDPEPGIMRITALGDWTNAGRVSADLVVSSVREDRDGRARAVFKGGIVEGQQRMYQVQVPAGVPELTLSLEWDGDWSRYPANDLDLIVFGPGGATNFDGATLDSPEQAVIKTPAAGTWTIYVDGYTVNTGADRFKVLARW